MMTNLSKVVNDYESSLYPNNQLTKTNEKQSNSQSKNIRKSLSEPVKDLNFIKFDLGAQVVINEGLRSGVQVAAVFQAAKD